MNSILLPFALLLRVLLCQLQGRGHGLDEDGEGEESRDEVLPPGLLLPQHAADHVNCGQHVGDVHRVLANVTMQCRSAMITSNNVTFAIFFF